MESVYAILIQSCQTSLLNHSACCLNLSLKTCARDLSCGGTLSYSTGVQWSTLRNRDYACMLYMLMLIPWFAHSSRGGLWQCPHKTRAQTEMTFGQLKGSKLIKYILHIFCSLTTFQKKGLTPDQVCFIMIACTVRNIATIRRKRLPQVLAGDSGRTSTHVFKSS